MIILKNTITSTPKGSKVVKWVKIFKAETALEIQEARPTDACGEV